MNPQQRSFFRDEGHLLLSQALSSRQLVPLREFILSELKRAKIWASGKKLSSRFDDVPAFQRITRIGSVVRPPDLAARIVPPEVRSLIDALAGSKLRSAGDAQTLISLPQPEPWSLAGLNWHVDVSTPDPRRLPGIQVFVLLDDVRPRGGATLALAGSHLQIKNGEARRRTLEVLADDSRAGEIEARLADLGVTLLEMSGRAGDVYLMDMRLLHTPSVNATKHPRLMATVRFFAD